MSPLSTPALPPSPRTDRRTRARKRIAAAATVMASGRLVDAVAIDVSPGGLRLVSATPLKAGTKIEVALILDGEVLDALATVCWSAPHGGKHFAAGLSFEKLDHESRLHLATFCGQRLS
jgi:hypothetical protein